MLKNKNKRKVLKNSLCLVFAFMLSINSFSAVVSDNDGSAFITKAEFDSLKNDFQSQLDSYNTGIDSKIDSAIASYLAGIKMETSRKISPIIPNYQQIRWMHGPYMYFTNRRFTAYTTTAGSYVDTTGWQIINPENRRQCASDGYLWFHDKLMVQSFSEYNITMMIHPFNVPWAWGSGRGGVASSRGPTIYAPMKKESDGWAVYNTSGTFGTNKFKGEGGHGSAMWARPHFMHSFSPESRGKEFLGGVNVSTYQYNTWNNDQLYLMANTMTNDHIITYTFCLLWYTDGSTVYKDGYVRSDIFKAENPQFFTTTSQNLYFSGTGGNALKTACGYADFMGDYYSRSGNSLVEDNRWNTEAQFNGDMENYVYSMWGTNVTGQMNVAPPQEYDGTNYYLDLSNSPNSVTVPFKTVALSFGAQHPWGMAAGGHYGSIQASTRAWPQGEFSLTIPLFYRINWYDMLSGEFRYKGKSLPKAYGYPIVENVEKDGKIKLTIKYEERTSNDSSVVSLTPDHKIKTYFKNKPFTDSSGTFLRGYTNLDGTGTEVELNGTEWNKDPVTSAKEIKVNIPVKKGDDIWMRIDPLTSDGVYCAMTDINCDYTFE